MELLHPDVVEVEVPKSMLEVREGNSQATIKHSAALINWIIGDKVFSTMHEAYVAAMERAQHMEPEYHAVFRVANKRCKEDDVNVHVYCSALWPFLDAMRRVHSSSSVTPDKVAKVRDAALGVVALSETYLARVKELEALQEYTKGMKHEYHDVARELLIIRNDRARELNRLATEVDCLDEKCREESV